jgi:hypothetical protein
MVIDSEGPGVDGAGQVIRLAVRVNAYGAEVRSEPWLEKEALRGGEGLACAFQPFQTGSEARPACLGGRRTCHRRDTIHPVAGIFLSLGPVGSHGVCRGGVPDFLTAHPHDATRDSLGFEFVPVIRMAEANATRGHKTTHCLIAEHPLKPQDRMYRADQHRPEAPCACFRSGFRDFGGKFTPHNKSLGNSFRGYATILAA